MLKSDKEFSITFVHFMLVKKKNCDHILTQSHSKKKLYAKLLKNFYSLFFLVLLYNLL